MTKTPQLYIISGCNGAGKTTASFTIKTTILSAKANGYNVVLVYFWLNSVELAKERVKTRVQEGGHNIDSEVIRRRYFAGIKNLFELYLPIVDVAMIYDNSNINHIFVAEKEFDKSIVIINNEIFNKILKYYDSTVNK
jgi:predicted ABC-type ATPase